MTKKTEGVQTLNLGLFGPNSSRPPFESLPQRCWTEPVKARAMKGQWEDLTENKKMSSKKLPSQDVKP
jgi:hypothetical protein